MRRSINWCVLWIGLLAVTVGSTTPAVPAQAQGSYVARVSTAMHQVANSTDARDLASSQQGEVLAAWVSAALVVGLCCTIVALVGLRACGRSDHRSGFRYRRL